MDEKATEVLNTMLSSSSINGSRFAESVCLRHVPGHPANSYCQCRQKNYEL